MSALVVVLVSLTLAGQPDTVARTPAAGPDDLADRVAYVDVTLNESDAFLVALDDGGEAVGSIAWWIDEAGTTWLASDYEEGSELVRVEADGQVVVEYSDLDPAIFNARAQMFLDHLDRTSDPQAGWVGCALSVAVAVGTCAGGAATGGLSIVACPGAAGYATCECITAWAEPRGRRPCEL